MSISQSIFVTSMLSSRVIPIVLILGEIRTATRKPSLVFLRIERIISRKNLNLFLFLGTVKTNTLQPFSKVQILWGILDDKLESGPDLLDIGQFLMTEMAVDQLLRCTANHHFGEKLL